MKDAFSASSLNSLLAHADWVRGLARTLVFDQDQVDELVQKTWIAAWQESSGRVESPKAWLGTVLRNFVRQSRRESSRRRSREEIASRPEALPSTSDLAEQAELQARLVRSVLDLEEPYRSTVLLHFFKGMSLAQIASESGIPDSTVRNRLKRALDQLRERLDRESRGNRQAWCLAFIPLALPKGLAVMGAKTLGGIAAVVLLTVSLGGLGIWMASGASTSIENSKVVASNLENTDSGRSGLGLESAEPSGAARSPAISPSTEGLGLRLALRYADGRTASGVRLVLVKDGELYAQGWTDDRGHAGFDAFEGLGDAYVLGASAGLFHESIQGKGDQEIRLPEGGVISGTVRIDGRAPAEPIRVSLRNLDVSSVDENVKRPSSESVLRALYWGSQRYAQRTSSDGSFYFSSLPKDWSGELVFADKYEALEPGSLDVRPRRESYEIHLHELHVIRGRVVKAGTQEPIADAYLQYKMKRARGEASQGSNLPPDGRFEIPIPRKGSIHASIHLSSRSTQRQRILEIDVDGTRSIELGDIELGESRRLFFTVKNPQGEPVPGVEIQREGEMRGEVSTDQMGKGTLTIADSYAGLIALSALGYRGAAVQVPLLGQDSVEVTLEPSTLLGIRLRTETGSTKGVQIRLASVGSPFESGKLPFGVVVGAATSSADTQGKEFSLFATPYEGRFLFVRDLIPNHPLKLQAVDGLGTVLQEIEISLEAAERRDVELWVGKRSRALEILVADRNGLPVADAQIQLRGREAFLITDREGRCKVDDLYAEAVSLFVHHPDIGAIAVDALPLSDGPVKLVLPHSPITVSVVDEEGLALPVDRLLWKLEDSFMRPCEGVRNAAGQFSVPGAWDRPLVLQAFVEGFEFEQVCPPGQREVKIVTPVPGALEIEIDLALDFENQKYHLMGLKVGGPLQGFQRPIMRQDGATSLRVSLPLLFPGKYRVMVLGEPIDGSAPTKLGPYEVDVVAGQTTTTTIGH